ncbi:MAG TPA: serine hydrolase domain-containing protein [Candidatus Acidoferrum sp.]|nr:serine hydrolase domain-containing protein [Candidatus Acidoferrum sp.]
MRRVRLAAAVLLFLSVTLAFPPPPATAQQKEDLPHPKTLEELQKAMKDVLEKDHVPGAGVALVARGELLWCGGLGKADVAANRDVTCDTEFRVGSISKTFVALALLKLQEEGKINLYARLQDIAPEVPFKNRWEAAHPVRIVNLLEHTTGFDDMEPAEVYMPPKLKYSPDYPLLSVFKEFQEPQNARWPPGTRMSYSNPGYAIAGYLIQKISGQPFDAYIQQNILAPIGTSVGGFRMTEAILPNLAKGYQGNPPQAAPSVQIYLRPAGDLKASPGELAKLVQLLLRRGKAGDAEVVKTESILRMEAPETSLAAKSGLRLGYGLGNYTNADGGVITHGHNGGIEGFLSSYRYMPEQNWGYVVLLNSTNSGRALNDLNRLAIDFLSKDFPKPQQAAIHPASSELKKFTGYYAPRAPRNQIFAFLDDLTGGTRIRIINGELTRSGLFGNPEPLLRVGKNLFRSEKEPEGTTIFFTNEAGRMAIVGNGIEGIPYSERSYLVLPFLRIGVLTFCLFFLLTTVPFALVWIPLKLFGMMNEVLHLSVRAIPFFATLALSIVPGCFLKLNDPQIGTFNLWTFGIFLGTFFFPLLSIAGLIQVLRVPRDEIHRAIRIHSLVVSSACCVLTGFLLSWHLFALRLWAP